MSHRAKEPNRSRLRRMASSREERAGPPGKNMRWARVSEGSRWRRQWSRARATAACRSRGGKPNSKWRQGTAVRGTRNVAAKDLFKRTCSWFRWAGE